MIWPSARTNGATSKTYLAYVFAVAIPGVRLRVAWVRITAAAFAAGVLAVTALPMPAEARKPPQVLFVTNWGTNNLSVLRVGADGSLVGPRELAPMPPGGRNPLAAVRSRDGRFLYVSLWGSGAVAAFRISATGKLASARSVAPAPPTPTNSAGVALTPDGRHLYVANFNGGGPGTVSAFRVGPSDALVPAGLPAPTGGAQPDFGGLVLS